MADGVVQVPPDSTGSKVDGASLPVGGNTVIRQRMIIGDNSATAQFATVTGGALLVVQNGAVNISAMPTVTVTGGVAISGTASCTITSSVPLNISNTPSVVLAAGSANFGTLNGISATVSVINAAGTANIGGVSLVAGTANIGFINNISATVTVAGTVSLGAGTALIGAVSLAAGTANIGFLNGISATISVINAAGTALMGAVSLAAGTAKIGFIGKVSATCNTVIGAGTSLIGAVSIAAGTAKMGFVGKISATVNTVVGAGTANMGGVSLVAGTANIGFINNISATVTVQGIVQQGPVGVPTASHGPFCATLSTSVGVSLVAAPGAGLHVYVTSIACTNGSGTLTRADVFAASLTTSCVCQMYMAANGGGFVALYDPPIKILSNTAVTARVKPNVSQCIFNINFYVGA